MYQVLIADDEYWVGRWLSEVLSSGPYDVHVIGVSQNGEEARQVLSEQQVDILITDINMPILSGLELIRTLGRRGEKPPKTIVISGYDEFEYARQAIELEVISYLLKPLERKELYKAVDKAIELLDREQAQADSRSMGLQARAEALLAEYSRSPREELRERLKEMFEKWAVPGGACYALGILQTRELENSALPGDILREKLGIVCHGSRLFLYQKDRSTWGLMIAGFKAPRGFAVDAGLFEKELPGYSFGVSGYHLELDELDEAAREAREAMIHKQEMPGDRRDVLTSAEELHIRFLSAIKARDRRTVKECSDLAADFFIGQEYDLTGCLNFYFVLAGEVIKLLTDYFRSRNAESRYLELVEAGYDFSVRIRNHYSIRSICRRFMEYTEQVIDCLGEDERMDISAIIKKARQIICENYADDLSLGSIADEFGINPSYFSKKFKDETGVNFIEFLTSVRLNQARALLEHTDMTVAAVGAGTGFRDAKYFSKVFAVSMNEKPSEYRERIRRERKIDGK